MSVHNSIVCESLVDTAATFKKTVSKNAGFRHKNRRLCNDRTPCRLQPGSAIHAAVRDGNTYILNGTKRFITPAKTPV